MLRSCLFTPLRLISTEHLIHPHCPSARPLVVALACTYRGCPPARAVVGTLGRTVQRVSVNRIPSFPQQLSSSDGYLISSPFFAPNILSSPIWLDSTVSAFRSHLLFKKLAFL